MRLQKFGLGFAGGMVVGLYMAIITIVSMHTGYGAELLKMWEPLLPGYGASYMGALIGFGYGFLDGFVCLFLLAMFYNMCARCCSKD